MSTVLVVQPSFEGHRLHYVGLVVREAIDQGWAVHLLVAPSATESAEWQLHLPEVSDAITVHPSGSFSLGTVRAAAERVGADSLLFPDGDGVLTQLWSAGSWRWWRSARPTVLVMRTRAQKVGPVGGRVRTIGKLGLRVAARTVFRARVLELVSALSSATEQDQVRDPVTMLASASDRSRLRGGWGLEADVHWFSVLGVLTARKNIPLVVSALCRVTGPVGVLFAGSVSPEIETEMAECLGRLESAGIPVRSRMGMLSDQELDEAVVVSDTVVLAHSNEGPSGILGKASAAGTRIVCAGAESLREDIALAPDLGEWAELTEDALVAALTRALHLSPPDPRSFDQEREFARKLLGAS